MKAIVNTGPNRLEMRELPLPEPGPGQVRIRTGACGICATDLEMIAGWDRTGFPAVPGHEWAGTVDAVGENADPALIGKKCVAENVLADGGEVGFEHPGGYAQYLITESRNLQLLPAEFSLRLATLIEPLAVCVRGLNRLGNFETQKPVLIFGDGPIGLLLAMLMAKKGVKNLSLIGGRDYRLDLARQFGASATLNYHRDSLDNLNQKFSTITEASGSTAAMKTAFNLITPCGKILVLGDYKKSCADFYWNHLLHREIELVGSNASAGAWPEAARLAVEGQLPLEKLVTHRLPAAGFAQGIDLMQSRRGDVIKVVMEWE
jgi:2-desacetyl-2-hydroxyethyl bacteriochlorophyllide A dehydrogenase